MDSSYLRLGISCTGDITLLPESTYFEMIKIEGVFLV